MKRHLQARDDGGSNVEARLFDSELNPDITEEKANTDEEWS